MWKHTEWRSTNILQQFAGQYVLLHVSKVPPRSKSATRLDFENKVAAAARIARNNGMLQEGQGLELVSTPGLASGFMHIGNTEYIDKGTVMSNKDAWEASVFVSAEVLDAGYYTRIAHVVPTVVGSNTGVERGSLCVQTCEVHTHQLPAGIDMTIMTYTDQQESARRAAIEVQTRHTKAAHARHAPAACP